MNARQAWVWLNESANSLGVITGNRQCFLIGSDQVECDVSDNAESTVTLSQSEFMDEFGGCKFRAIETRDMAG